MAKPAVGWLDTPKVRPADWLMPGLLKLKPELLPPKPREARQAKQKVNPKEKKNLSFRDECRVRTEHWDIKFAQQSCFKRYT